MDVDVASVPGYLYMWAIGRARAAAGAVTGAVDTSLEAVVGRLAAVVRRRLGEDHDALAGLEEEAEAAAADTTPGAGAAGDPALSQETHGALVYALTRAVKNDPAFARDLAEALGAVKTADIGSMTSSSGGGTTAGGGITMTTSGDQSPVIGGNTGDLTFGNLPPAPAAVSDSSPGEGQDGKTGREERKEEGREEGKGEGEAPGPSRPGPDQS